MPANNPAFGPVLGERCLKTVSEVSKPIDTITSYMAPTRSEILISEILEARQRRIIFNPDSKNHYVAPEARPLESSWGKLALL